jgi:hypothetical protein
VVPAPAIVTALARRLVIHGFRTRAVSTTAHVGGVTVGGDVRNALVPELE